MASKTSGETESDRQERIKRMIHEDVEDFLVGRINLEEFCVNIEYWKSEYNKPTKFRSDYNPVTQKVERREVEGEEVDPDGLGQHEPGAKLDKGKQRANLVLRDFSMALGKVVEVGTYGAAKYSDSGWTHVEKGQQRYADAMMRHYLAMGTEMNDPESGISHQAHMAWNALAWLELSEKEVSAESWMAK